MAVEYAFQNEMWLGLARIEHVHVTMLRQLARHIQQGSVVWNLGLLKRDGFRDEDEMISAAKQELAEGRMNVEKAVTIADRIVNSMFHSKFYEVMNCDLPYFKGTSNGLRRTEARFVEMLQESMTLQDACA